MSKNKVSLNTWQQVLLALLLAATVFQVYQFVDTARVEILPVWKTIGQSRLWRSANYAHSQRFAEFVVFLNETVPQDAQVVLPPVGSGPRLFGHTSYMQYFLQPRVAFNCTGASAECQQRFAEGSSYVLVADPEFFPNDEDYGPRLAMFNEDWGLVVPPDAPKTSGWTDQGFDSLAQIASQALLPLLWLVLLTLPGALLVSRIHPAWNAWLQLLVGVCLGLGTFSFALFLVLLYSQHITAVMVWGITLLWALLALVLWRRGGSSKSPSKQSIFPLDGWVMAILLLTAVNLFLSVGKSYYASDALIIWANKGYAIAAKGLSAGVTEWGLGSWKYTLNIPLLIAACQKDFGDLLPASKLIYPLYTAALLLGMYTFLQRYITRGAAGLASLAYGTSAIMLRHARIGYANMAFTAQLVLATLLVIEALHEKKPARPTLLLAAWLYALAAWSRAEGVVIGLLLIAWAFFLGWRAHGRAWLIKAWPLAAPLLVLALTWNLTAELAYVAPRANTGALGNALTQMLQGNFNVNEGVYALRSLFATLLDFSTWGVVGLGALLFWLPRRQSTIEAARAMLWFGGGLVLAVALGTIYATTYGGGCDVSCWVNSGLDRYIMPGITFMWLVSILSLFQRHE